MLRLVSGSCTVNYLCMNFTFSFINIWLDLIFSFTFQYMESIYIGKHCLFKQSESEVSQQSPNIIKTPHWMLKVMTFNKLTSLTLSSLVVSLPTKKAFDTSSFHPDTNLIRKWGRVLKKLHSLKVRKHFLNSNVLEFLCHVCC